MAPEKPRSFQVAQDETFRPHPWIALVCMGLCYALMGWYSAGFPTLWRIAPYCWAFGASFMVIWSGQFLYRMLLSCPRLLSAMVSLTLGLTVAIASPTGFILIIMLVASTLFSRLELQTAGVSRFWALVIISIVAGIMIGAGWACGEYLYGIDPFWVQWIRQRLRGHLQGDIGGQP
ncbi:hypothetical protein [Lyngbya confervoides]|uniref:Uncharacterized protein n=1 Tax=Lyngbya confervoides BDU141951 TaxID=1574623 RepID=A0ABD4T2Y0_9CYAN|nr:hypothetical protein [Lyngbya confervoides]MCM1983058.1 hypothetical protein [Lyngbya confervoides BDU141951]